MTREIAIAGYGGEGPVGQGAYRMTDADYHRDPCVQPSLSSGVAKVLVEASAAHAREIHPRLNPAWQPSTPSPRMALGSLCHALLLGRGTVRVLPYSDFRTKAAQVARAEVVAAGEVPVLAEQYEFAEQIVASAREQLAGTELAELVEGRGDGEVAVFAATPERAWVRAKVDWWASDRTCLVDYKTTSGLATAERFSRQAAELGYDIQAAFYERVVAAAYPWIAGRTRFVFVAQEVEPPFALAAYELSEAELSVARRKVDAALGAWVQCLESGRWPGYSRGIQRLTLPPWYGQRWLDREYAAGDGGDWILSEDGGAR